MKNNRIKKRQAMPVWLGLMCMMAGGIGSVGISQVQIPSFYVEIGGGEGNCLQYIKKGVTGLTRNGKVRSVSLEEESGNIIFTDGLGKEPHMALQILAEEVESPDRLNSAYCYDDEMSQGNVSKSVAGRVYETLSKRDSEWIHAIYALGKIAPQDMASRLGAPVPEVSEWNRIRVTFRDGDGAPISGYSNAREILSLVSVYAYFHEIEDYSSFQSYGDKLWNSSHSYNMSMSDVYYCEGECQYIEKDIDEELMDGESDLIELLDEVKTQEIHPDADEEGGESDEAVEESSSDAEESTDESLGESGEVAGESDEAASESGEVAGEAVSESGETVMESSEVVSESGEDENRVSDEEEGQESGQDGQVAATVSNARRNSPPNEKKKKCQGHIDLNVSVRITGLTEKKNLYAIDPIGSKAEEENSQWNGWDETTRDYVQTLTDQDWYDQYGLASSTSMYVRNPLSSSEVRAYLNMLPSDTSSKRQEVVKQALMSIGCIPYYWGGKPSHSGYEGNGFGTVVSPDEDGRILRGLDCSGWINWVYWTALGSRLPYESTAGLISCGKGINKEELQAGDILIRGGEERHVYMFLAWADDGSMYLIHETTGTVNNVTINTYDLDLPYYRSLITE